MSADLEMLGRRVDDDPFFMACVLKRFAKSEGFDDGKLAAALGCAKENLVLIRLCRAPRAQAATFLADIERIATRFDVSAEVLVEAVRRGQAIFQMAEAGKTKRTLWAARDGASKKKRKNDGGQT